MGAIVTSEFNGMRLTLAREIQNISSPKLAEKIGVTKQTVSQYENGLIKPSADKVLAISQELKFPPKFFFEGSSDNFSPGVAYCRATTTTTRAVKLRQTNIDVLKSYIYDFFAEYIEYPSTEQLIDCMAMLKINRLHFIQEPYDRTPEIQQGLENMTSYAHSKKITISSGMTRSDGIISNLPFYVEQIIRKSNISDSKDDRKLLFKHLASIAEKSWSNPLEAEGNKNSKRVEMLALYIESKTLK